MNANQSSPFFVLGYHLRAMAVVGKAIQSEMEACEAAFDADIRSRLREILELPPAPRSQRCFSHNLERLD